MSYVIITELAANGMERCRRFLTKKSLGAAKRVAIAIDKKLLLLEELPEIGRPFPDMTGLRELLIDFGDSGYVALYHYDSTTDSVYILDFKHQKEAGYKGTKI